MFSKAMITKLKEMAGASTLKQLMLPESLDKVEQTLKKRMSTEDFELALGKVLSATKQSAMNVPRLHYSHRLRRDYYDLVRGWGFRLLPENDPAFTNPNFLVKYIRQSSQTGTGYADNDVSSALYEFHEAWKKIAPKNVEPIAFVQTGTDANNLVYSLAKEVNDRKLYKKAFQDFVRQQTATVELGPPKETSAEILYFEGSYGGAYGRINKISFMQGGKGPLEIPSPVWHTLDPQRPDIVAQLEAIENQALTFIQNRISEGSPIGGILLEPIIGARGVLFYRTEFLSKLRSLCDQLQIPLIADEILTGGGRTGKFFAYQHYEGFEPDYITFGKGLQTAGIARVNRGKMTMPYSWKIYGATNSASTDGLLKGAAIMNRIREDNLMENAKKIGDYFVSQIQATFTGSVDDVSFREQQRYPHGVGLLIWIGHHTNVNLGPTAMGRLMPPMTITKQQVDELLKNGKHQ